MAKEIKYEYNEENDICLTRCPYNMVNPYGKDIKVGAFACHHCSYFVKDNYPIMSVVCNRDERRKQKMSKQGIADIVQDWLYAHLPPEMEWCPNVENGNCETITNEAFAQMVRQLIAMKQDLA